jgi:hypothetical protein
MKIIPDPIRIHNIAPSRLAFYIGKGKQKDRNDRLKPHPRHPCSLLANFGTCELLEQSLLYDHVLDYP